MPASGSPQPPSDPSLDAEAAAFDQRISERRDAGFIPDLRRAAKCDYFYKSFWRDPHFARLYLGEHVQVLLEFLRRHGRHGLSILDVGCGPGYYSLELARAGYRVTGIDIASKAIEAARAALASSPRDPDFGSLDYEVRSLEEAEGQFDAITFTGVIHHFPDPDAVLQRAADRLVPGGLLLCLEPCHEQWRQEDAAVVALIRGLLAATGHWYEPTLAPALRDPAAWRQYTEEIRTEYLTERDPHERGQSPNDNASSGDEILAALRRRFDELEFRNGVSFIYRLLGGLRGPDAVVHPLADLLASFDRFAVADGYLRPNAFLWCGRDRRP